MSKINNKQKNDLKIRRIGIDARFFSLENKGLGRYTNELVRGIDKILAKRESSDSRVEYYIFLKSSDWNDFKPQAGNIHKVRADFRWYSWAEQLKFPFLLNKYNLDLVHFPHFNIPLLYRKKFIVTIHDLILFHYPTIKNSISNRVFYWFKLAGYHLTIRMAVKRAVKIIAISKFTKKDIENTLRVNSQKIIVVYEGADFNQDIGCGEKDDKSEIFEKYGIIKPYLLYVGNAYPHKNLERLILAFQKYNEGNSFQSQLLLIGKDDYFYQRIKKFIKDNNVLNVVVTDYVEDNVLECIYKKADLFVFPSLYEGFGLPPLEALVRKLPVASSNRSSLPEILGKDVCYFNPESIEDMAREIKDCLQRKTILEENQIKEFQNKFSWEKMTKELMKIYVQIK